MVLQLFWRQPLAASRRQCFECEAVWAAEITASLCCHVQERVSLRDCQVGPSYVVGEGGDFKGEVLAKK